MHQINLRKMEIITMLHKDLETAHPDTIKMTGKGWTLHGENLLKLTIRKEDLHGFKEDYPDVKVYEELKRNPSQIHYFAYISNWEREVEVE